MKFSRKLQKMFGRDALESAWEHAVRWTHPVNARGMFKKLDAAEVDRLRRAYPHVASLQAHDAAKFADIEYWIKNNAERAQDLWLDRSPPLRVLDLGCGAGYFLYVCRCLGHEALGLDLDEMPLFRETMTLLKTHRRIWRIEPLEPLPKFNAPFDLVTAYCVCFQKIARAEGGKWSQWGVAEWDFFLRDVRERILQPEGRLLLHFNPQPDGNYYPQAVGNFFREQGARFFRSKVLFSAEGAGAAPSWTAYGKLAAR